MPRRPDQASLSVRIDAAVAQRVRNFVASQAGDPLRLKLGTFIEAAIIKHLAETEALLAGKRDPQRISENNHEHHPLNP